MEHKVIVCSDKGSFDSLTKPVQIVFTLTPVGSEAVTRSYDPVALGHMVFSADSNERQAFEWGSEFAFGKYAPQAYLGRSICASVGAHTDALPGSTYSASGTGWKSDVRRETQPADGLLMKQPSVCVISVAGAPQELALQLKGPGPRFIPLVAYRPLKYGKSIIASTDLALQAYIVEGEGCYNGDILTPEHLTRPLFDRALHCNALPALPTWRLSQDPEGRILLKTGEGSESVAELRRQLSAVSMALDATQQRLAVLELAGGSRTPNPSTTPLDTGDIESRLAQAPPIVRAKPVEIREFTGASLAVRAQLAELRVLAGRVKEPTKPSTASAGGSVVHLERSVAGGGGMLPVIHSQGSMSAGGRSTGEQSLDAAASIPQAQDAFLLQESLRTLRQQVAGLDRRVPALESVADQLTRGLGETSEDLASVFRMLQTTREQVSGLEPVIEKKVNQLMEALTTTTDYVEDLASRVIVVEDKAETLIESLIEIRESRVGSRASFSQVADDASIRFPSGSS